LVQPWVCGSEPAPGDPGAAPEEYVAMTAARERAADRTKMARTDEAKGFIPRYVSPTPFDV
jgi:hypothetical protein